MVDYFAASRLTFKNPYSDAIPVVISRSNLMGNIDGSEKRDTMILLEEMVDNMSE